MTNPLIREPHSRGSTPAYTAAQDAAAREQLLEELGLGEERGDREEVVKDKVEELAEDEEDDEEEIEEALGVFGFFLHFEPHGRWIHTVSFSVFYLGLTRC